jgi:hypothetical protein
MSHDDAGAPTEHLRLLAELEQLEREERELDLRDARAVEECQRKIEFLRQKIARHLRNTK